MELVRKLLNEDNYEKRARPIKDLKKQVRVNVTFDYAQLIDVVSPSSSILYLE